MEETDSYIFFAYGRIAVSKVRHFNCTHFLVEAIL